MKFELETINEEIVISSKHIAEQFGRRHSDVMASVKGILNERECSFGSYIDKKGEDRTKYRPNGKIEFSFVAFPVYIWKEMDVKDTLTNAHKKLAKL